MRKALSIWIVATIAAIGAAALAADAPNISMELDRKRVIVDEPFQLTITIESTSSEEPQVRLPQFAAGLRVLQQSQSSPMSFSFSFGTGRQSRKKTTRQNVFQFVLVAQKKGEYFLKPVEVEVGGKRYRGEQFVITALESGASPSAQPARPSGQGRAQAIPGAPVQGVQSDDDYFVRAHLSRENAVVGEKVVLTLYLYAAWNLVDADVQREPGVEGFWLENLVGNQRTAQVERVTIDNRAYDRVALRRMALFPIESGRLSISPAVVEVVTQRGGLFRGRRKSIKRVAPEVFVEVAELPSASQPAGFNPANVGQYSWSTRVEPTSVRMGEPVTLVLEVEGEGNLRNLVLPEVADIPGFKLYAPESEVDVRYAGDRVLGSRQHKILMIPEQSGTLTVPSVSWSFFDSASKSYQTVPSQPIQVKVLASKSGAVPPPVAAAGVATDQPRVDTSSELVRLNRQLRSILSESPLRRGRTPIVASWWFWLLVIVPPVVLLISWVLFRVRRRAEAGRTRDLARRAHSRALKELSALGKRIGETDDNEIYGGLHRILIGFLERRLAAPVVGDTMAELSERLERRGFETSMIRELVAELESADFARFARVGGGAHEQRLAVERVEQVVRRLSKVKIEEGQ